MRRLENYVLIVFASLLALSTSGQVAATGDATLKNAVEEAYLPNVPLTTALTRVGYSVKGAGYVVFGTELLLNQVGEEPRVTLSLFPTDTVQTALDSVMRQLPNYKWVMVSDHLVNIFPVENVKHDLLLQQTRNDFLAIRVARFDVKDEYPPNILANLPLFIPELLRAVVSENSPPGGASGYGASYAAVEGPRRSMTFKDLTIRDILNGIVEEMSKTLPATHPPMGWTYEVRPDPKALPGRAHSWNAHRSVPESNWKEALAAATPK